MSRVSDRTLKRVAFFLAAIWISIQMAYLGFDIARGTDLQDYLEEFGLLIVVMGISFPAMGAVIASRQPRNLIVWVYLAVGTVSLGTPLGDYARFGLITRPGSLPGAVFASWAHNWIWFPGMALITTFAILLFPDGRLPSRRWRWHAIATGLGLAIMTASFATTSWIIRGRVGLEMSSEEIDAMQGQLPEWLWIVGEILFVVGIVGSLASLFFRYRKSSRDVRQQLKLVMFAAGLTVLTFLVVIFLIPEVRVPQVIAMPLVPIAAGIAILRRGLFDIDVVINKAVVYGALVATITGIYLLIVYAAGHWISYTGDASLAVAATLVIAMVFQPIRLRLQRLANRLVYGKRFTPYEAMARLSHQVSSEVSIEDVLPMMARVTAEGLGATVARVRLVLPDGTERSFTYPDGFAEDTFQKSVEVIDRGEVIGDISIRKPPNDPVNTSDEKLLADLASQAGLALRNVRLTEDLRASRRRIVEAQDEERRRMERDIHDGAQQQLVSMSVKLGLAKQLLTKDISKAQEMLEELKADSSEAVETLRDLARGLYPPILEEQGLVAALRSHIDKVGLNASIESNTLNGTRLDRSFEAAVYFVVREALQNASKHAKGAPIRVELHRTNSELYFEIKDRGPGFDLTKAKAGSGLQNMRDRIEALGGNLEIHSGTDHGTTVKGSLPVAVLEVLS